jgi:WD40 repeat protein
VVYRTGDQIGAWSFAGIAALGLGATAVAATAVPLSIAWLLNSLWLGRRQAERQALALMDHPHIARVLDAGATESGRPYFVMELVEGIGITVYCDRYNLSVRERLELFVQVCRAVEHAHQKGVIHRDLKPSNILVVTLDGRPVSKIIDFGVAKAINQRLTEHTLVTAQAQILGTPLYMSPEQAELGPVDVDRRSDVYSLGVLLYELLTGTTPFTRERVQAATYDALRTMIREEEPPRPSTRIRTLGESGPGIAEHRRADLSGLWHSVRGDLDWIAMKALEKDRARRYPTASVLATDVERHLNGLPVEAHAPSALYRLHKFTQRHSGFLTAAVVILAVVLAGLAAGTVLVAQERNVARAEAVRATDAATRESEAASNARREREEALRARNLALENLYFAHMHLALQDWYSGNIGRMQELVDAHIANAGEPDVRGWEWYYLYSLCHADMRAFRGHSGGVPSIALSPDGQFLASAGIDHTVRIWEMATLREVKALRGHEAEAKVVAWHSSGSLVAAGAGDGRIIVWDVATGAQRHVFQCEHTANGMAWSPNGRYLAAGGATIGGEISVTATGRIHIWDTTSGEQAQTLVGRGDMILALAWSPDGRYLAAGRNWPGITEVWETAAWQCVDSGQLHGHMVGTVAWSPDGQYLASGSVDHAINVRAAGTWQTVCKIPNAHRGVVNTVCWSSDGTKIVSGGDDGVLKIWEAATGHAVATIPARQRPVYSVIWDAGGQTLIYSGGDGLIRQCDPEVELETRTMAGRYFVAWSPDGQLLAAWGLDRNPATRTVDVFNAATGQRLFSLPNPSPGGGIGLEWSPDGSKLAVNNEGVIVWDLSTRQKKFQVLGRCQPRASAWSPDGRTLAVAGLDNVVYLVDANSGTTLSTFHEHTISVTSVAWKPDGAQIASADWRTGVKVWEPESGRVVFDLRRPDDGADGHHGICWSPNGDRLAAVCSNGEILIWDASNGEELRRLQGHTSRVRTIAWSPDGTRLASGGYDLYVKIWDPGTGREMLSLPGHDNSVDSIAWSPDSRQLATADILKLRIWDSTAGYQLAQKTGELEIQTEEPEHKGAMR